MYIGYATAIAGIVQCNWLTLTKVWLYAYTPTWVFAITMLVLVIYLVTSGVEGMKGVLPVSLLGIGMLLILCAFIFHMVDYRRLLPVAATPWSDIGLASIQASGAFLGFELLLRWLSLTEGAPRQVLLHLFIGNGLVTGFYIFLFCLCIMFFGDKEIPMISEPVLYL